MAEMKRPETQESTSQRWPVTAGQRSADFNAADRK
jgi:hypothetical protein